MANKSLDFEINLLPIISLLAVILSFLLVTVVWQPVGALSVSQSVGNAPTTKLNSGKNLSIWVQFNNKKSIKIFTRDGSMKVIGKIKNIKVKNKFNNQLLKHINKIIARYPLIKNAIVAPHSNTSFDRIIAVIDIVKTIKTLDIGVAPL